MKKDFIICLCAVIIGVCGWIGSKQWDRYQARKFAREQAAAAIVAEHHLQEEKNRTLEAMRAKTQHEAEVAAGQKKDAMAAERKQVEGELAGCKLTSIMLGPPNIAIINKKGYEPGAGLPLPSGKTLLIKTIQGDAVLLSDGQQSYRLALPTARDLGNSGR